MPAVETLRDDGQALPPDMPPPAAAPVPAPAAPPTGNPAAGAQAVTTLNANAFDAYQKQMDGVKAEIAKATDAAAEHQKPYQQGEMSAIESVRAMMKEQALQPIAELPPGPDMKMRQQSAGAIIGALFMGLIAGRMARTGGWDTAVMSAGAAMKSWREGEMDRMKGEVDTFHTAMERWKAYTGERDKRMDRVREFLKTDVNLADMELNLAIAQDAPGLKKVTDQMASIQQRYEAKLTFDERMDSHKEKMASVVEKISMAGEHDAKAALARAKAAQPGGGAVKPPSGYEADPDKPGALRPIAGGPHDPKAKPPSSAQAGRSKLVVGSADNALRLLGEIHKKYGAPTASNYFGVHPDGVIGTATYEAGRFFQSGRQKSIDADYAALVDEAIPVFTGGLRGSDSYRKFLIGQLPRGGDDKGSAAEKLRVFEDNVRGMRHNFSDTFGSDLSKYAADPKAAAEALAQRGGDDEASRAKAAIANGKDAAAVRALYKKNTGKDLPP